MNVLHVAEKHDSAKTISKYLSRNPRLPFREGKSKFNKIYEWVAPFRNYGSCKMSMTSVCGHLLEYKLPDCRKWKKCGLLELFDAKIEEQCKKYANIKKTLEEEVANCGVLIIWTDCDREGENIGFEIIKVCQAIKPNIQVYRAKFSEITQISIDRALRTLGNPDKCQSDAVDVRRKLDLKIGAAFTRFQTLALQKKFRILKGKVIGYGSCRFPALRFVVDRYLAVEKFRPESRWTLKVTHEQNGFTVEFSLAKGSFSEKLPCENVLNTCLENQKAKVVKVSTKPTSKSRPLPLNTELEKRCSAYVGLTVKTTMDIAEKLYTKGYISYPRTSTDEFSEEMDLNSLVGQQSLSNDYRRFVQGVLRDGANARSGEKRDQAHSPIHPIKFDRFLRDFTDDEARVYEFVVRHFLASVSKDAEGSETSVEIDIAGEKFVATGLQIIAKNYLEIFTCEEWNAKKIHNYQEGQTFQPTSIEIVEEPTPSPNLLTETDLITLMDEKGIGTNSTRAGIIEDIKKYVEVVDNKFLKPTKLGLGLIMGYDRMGLESITKPDLRAELENNLRLICEGEKQPDEVLKSTLVVYRNLLRTAIRKEKVFINTVAEYLEERPVGGRGGSAGFDGENQDNTSGPSTSGRGRGGGAGAASKRPTSWMGAGTMKRKCSNCGIEGHNKRMCRQNN